MGDNLHHISSLAELNALFASTTYVAIDFYADWCQPCKVIAPHYQKFAAQRGIPGVFAFAKANVDTAQDVARQYGISAMPTFMFFKEGKQVAVNGMKMIQGGDMRSLSAAVDKLAGLAEKRRDAAQ
ncbi:Allergen Fus c 2 [Xylariaceae sp. FL0016]|nr:Allergen Fus c 2 [Xylariaceae sp. FL0016]